MNSNNIRLSISGISCASCVANIETILKQQPQVNTASVNFAEHTATITGNADPQHLIQILTDAGYPSALMQALDDGSQQQQQQYEYYQQLLKKSVIALGFGGGLWLAGKLSLFPPLSNVNFWLLISMMTLAVILYTGWHFYQGAWQSLKHRQANMDTLIALGTASAWIYSTTVILFPEFIPSLAQYAYYESAILIIGFINFGHALETKTKSHTSAAIQKLLQYQPKTTRAIRNGQELTIAIADIGLDETLKVLPGERIAVDGVIIQGQPSIDESMITGEAIPNDKQVGDTVIGGTLNTTETFLYQAKQIGQDTLLARIISQVRQAQSSKPAIARFVDKIAAIFVPIVLLISIITFGLWLWLGPEPQLSYAFVAAVTVLVIACPCALGLATPISVMLAIGQAAEHGILIKDSQALQQASQINTIIFDKTGTLTQGQPKISQWLTTNIMPETKLKQYVASVENQSEHLFAKTIVTEVQAQGIALLACKDFNMTAGQGISGQVEQQQIHIGNQSYLQSNNIDFKLLPNDLSPEAGQTLLHIAVNQHWAGAILLEDQLKPTAKSAIKQLQQLGIEILLLTGDQTKTAISIAEQLGIKQVQAELLPPQKLEIIQQLQQQGKTVAMVGDGFNDAPALAQADIGFAMGHGTDVAIEAGDITLIKGDPNSVITTIKISQAGLTNIKQNLFAAFFYNSISIPIAAGLLYPSFGILLNPMVAGLAMALSSLTVVLNASRLRHYKIQS